MASRGPSADSDPHLILIYQQYREFTERLPRLAAEVGLEVQELTFRDLSSLINEWLRINVPASSSP
jgi:hypothetical protein